MSKEILLRYLRVAFSASLLSEEGQRETFWESMERGAVNANRQNVDGSLFAAEEKSKADTKPGKIWNHRREDSNLFNGLSCSESVFLSGIP